MSFLGNYFRNAKRTFKEALLSDELDEMPLCSKPKLTTPACYTSNDDGFESTSESNYQAEEILLSTLGQGFASRAAAAAADNYSLGNFPWVCPSGEKRVKTTIPSPRHDNQSGRKIRVRRPFYRPLDSNLDSSPEPGKSSSNIIQVLKELTTKTMKPKEAVMEDSTESKSFGDVSKKPAEFQHNLFMSQLETSVENVTDASLNENVVTPDKLESSKRRHLDSSLRNEIYSSLSSSLGMFNGKPINYVGSSKPKKVKRMKIKTSSIGVQTAEKPRESLFPSASKQAGNTVFEAPVRPVTTEMKQRSPEMPKAPPLQPSPVSESTAKVILKSAMSKFQKSGFLDEGRTVGLPTIGPPVLPVYEQAKTTTVEVNQELPKTSTLSTFANLVPIAAKQQDPQTPFNGAVETKTAGFQLPVTTSSMQFNLGFQGGQGTQVAKPEGSVASGFQFSAPALNKTTESDKLPESTKASIITTTASGQIQPAPGMTGFAFKAPSEQKQDSKPENKTQQGFSGLPPATTSSTPPVIPSTTSTSPPRIGGFSFTPTVTKTTTSTTAPVTTASSAFTFGTTPAAVTTPATVQATTAALAVSAPSGFKFSFGSQQQPQSPSQSQPLFTTQTQPQLQISQPATTTQSEQVKETPKPVFSFGSDNKFSFSATPATTTSSQPVFNSNPKFSFSSSKLNTGSAAPKLDGFPPVTIDASKLPQNLFSSGGSIPLTTAATTTAASSSAFTFGGGSSFDVKPGVLPNPPSFGNQQPSNPPSFGVQQATNPPSFSTQQPTNPPSFSTQQPTNPPSFSTQQTANPPSFSTQQPTNPPSFSTQQPTNPPSFSTQQPSNPPPFSAQQSSNAPSFSTQQPSNPPAFGSTSMNPPAFGSTPNTTSALFPSFSTTAPKTSAPFAFGSSNSFALPSSSTSTTTSITKPVDSSFKFGQTNTFSFTPTQQPNKPAVTPAPTFGSSAPAFGTTPSFGATGASSTATSSAFSFGGTSTFGSSSTATVQGSAPPAFPTSVTAPAPPSFGSTAPLQSNSSALPPSFGAPSVVQQPSLPPTFGQAQPFAFGSAAASAAPSAGPANGNSMFQFGTSNQPSGQQPFSFSAGTGTAPAQGFGFPATGFAPVGGAMFSIGSGTVTPRSRQRQRKK